MAREYRKCPSCHEYRHDYMYPWADPDGNFFASLPRTDTPKANAAYGKRVIAAVARRTAARAKGRDYSACLPCRNGDAA